MRIRLLVIVFAVCGLWKVYGAGYLQPIATVSTNTDLKALYGKFQLPIVIIGTTAYVPSDDCQCNEPRNIGGDTQNRQIAGDTDQRQIGGDTAGRQIGGDTDQRQIGGDTADRQIAGDTDQRQLGGDSAGRQVAGDTDQRQIGGDTADRQIAGDTDQRQIGGDMAERQVAGGTDQRQLGGDTQDRQIAGGTDQRQMAGDISQIPCIKLDDCSGFRIVSTNTLEISVFNGTTNQPLSGTVVLFNGQN